MSAHTLRLTDRRIIGPFFIISIGSNVTHFCSADLYHSFLGRGI